LEIDLQGADKIFSSGFQANFLFIQPPSLELLKERLTLRGTETAEVIEKRIARAQVEMDEAPKKDFFTSKITNDDLERAYKEFVDLIKTLYQTLIF
jgi:guanylate kinase